MPFLPTASSGASWHGFVKAHAHLAPTRRRLANAGGRPTQTAPVPVASNLHSRLSTSPIRGSDAVLLRTETWCAGPPRAGRTANTARHAGILHDAPSRAIPRGTPRESVLPLCSLRRAPPCACPPTRPMAGAGCGQRAHRAGDVRKNLCMTRPIVHARCGTCVSRQEARPVQGIAPSRADSDRGGNVAHQLDKQITGSQPTMAAMARGHRAPCGRPVSILPRMERP
jgi:hypothetical protein